jgi:hypothetical protein
LKPAGYLLIAEILLIIITDQRSSWIYSIEVYAARRLRSLSVVSDRRDGSTIIAIIV